MHYIDQNVTGKTFKLYKKNCNISNKCFFQLSNWFPQKLFLQHQISTLINDIWWIVWHWRIYRNYRNTFL